MTLTLNHALKTIGSQPAFSREWEERLEARVRREIITRYGSFALPVRSGVQLSSSPALNLSSSPAFWLFSLKGMFLQPAMAFASIAAIAIGIGVFQLVSHGGSERAPTVSMSEPIARPAVVAEILPGSGSALSVFILSQNTAEAQASTSVKSGKTWRKSQPLNPAAGVFTNWGTNVFSKEELMRQRAKELAVFSG